MDFIINLFTWIAGILFVLAMITSCVVVTEQEHVRIIETFGRFAGVRKSGLSFKAPWPIQSASDNFSTQIEEMSLEVSAKSNDKAFVLVPVNVQIRVDEDNAELAYYKLKNPGESIRSYVKNRVRGKAATMSFDELFQSQEVFQTDVFAELSDRMASFGFIIENLLVDDPQPSEKLRESFDRVLASERLKEAAVNEGEAARTLAVAKAKAEGEALGIRGEAYKTFRQTIAEGNAEAIKQFVGETGLRAEAVIDFFTSINEMEAVTSAASSGAKVVFVTGAAKGNSTEPALLGLAGNDAGAPSGAVPAAGKGKVSPYKAKASEAASADADDKGADAESDAA